MQSPTDRVGEVRLVARGRGVAGKLRIDGHRLDGQAPPLTAHVPDGYGDSGFQSTGITFPTEGCWRVPASATRASPS